MTNIKIAQSKRNNSRCVLQIKSKEIKFIFSLDNKMLKMN